ncbi:SDR family oxidoreductase [Streptomyces thermocarboxydus]
MDEARSHVGERLALTLGIAKYGGAVTRDGGTLVFVGGTGGRRPGIGTSVTSALTAALPALTASLAVELAPVRVNLVAPGFVDTPCPRRSSATGSRNAASDCARRSRYGGSSARTTWPR